MLCEALRHFARSAASIGASRAISYRSRKFPGALQKLWNWAQPRVCMQAGLPPDMDGAFYIDLTRAVKAKFPESAHPRFLAGRSVVRRDTCRVRPFADYLVALKAAGLGSLPGTSAEILDQEVRDVILPAGFTVRQWVEVDYNRHGLGIPTPRRSCTATWKRPFTGVKHMNFASRHPARHARLSRIRSAVDGLSRGPMYHNRLRRIETPDRAETKSVKMHAVARLMLGASHAQHSVVMGKGRAQPCAVPAVGRSQRRWRHIDE
jgi:hypothetical protein